MLSNGEENLDKPERPDESYVQPLIKDIFNQRTAILGISAVALCLCFVIVMLVRRPVPVIVVDKETGQTTASLTKRITYDVLERQLLYYSRQFCEDYFGRNHVNIASARARAIEIMHPNMRVEAEKSFPPEVVAQVEKERWGDNIEWRITSVTGKNDPRYAVFCQFVQTVTKPGFAPIVKTYNIRLDWGRLGSGVVSPYQRPHNLVLLKASELASGSDELNKQLNLSY